MLTNMTIKGQVTIPRDLRKTAGLTPGRPVRVELNDRGEVVVRPIDEATDRERRANEIRTRIAEVQRSFREQDQMPGLTNDEWYRMVRGAPPEV
jgi:AbrB family looped-hinge helix DNA binding protein